MKASNLLTLAAALAAVPAFADFEINLDPKATPIKDQRPNDCGPSLGYNGGMLEFCNARWVYQEYPDTLKVFRDAGVRLLMYRGQKYWAQCIWAQKKLAEFRASGKKLEDLPKAEQKEVRSWMTEWPDVKAVWDFWKKNGIRAFVSDDEGKTWKGGLRIDPRARVANPDAFQAPDGSIYVTYDHDRNTKRDEILFAKFTEADVLAGRLVTAGSSLRNVIFSEGGRPGSVSGKQEEGKDNEDK